MKPTPFPVYDSEHIDRYMKKEYGFSPEFLRTIVEKVRSEVFNGCLFEFDTEMLSEDNFPQLNDKEREYITVILDEFGSKVNYPTCVVKYWW